MTTKVEMEKAAILSARLGGCTCKPDVTISEPTPGVYATSVAHDSWCGHRRDEGSATDFHAKMRAAVRNAVARK